MFSSKRERSGAELLPRDDEAFAERLDMLASTVSSTAAALARTDGEIAVLRRELGSGLARLEELTAELRSRARASDVHELQKTVGSLTIEHSKTSEGKRLDDLSAKVALLLERVDTLASTVATTAASVAGRDGEVAALRRQFSGGPQGSAVDDVLLRRVEDAASASATASLRVESHGEQIIALVRRADEIEERLSELTERLGAAEERGAQVAAELQRAMSLWPAALRALEARVDELGRSFGEARDERPKPVDDPHVLGALQTLERRMQRADESARAEREAVLDRLERLTLQLGASHDRVPETVEVLPLATER